MMTEFDRRIGRQAVMYTFAEEEEEVSLTSELTRMDSCRRV